MSSRQTNPLKRLLALTLAAALALSAAATTVFAGEDDGEDEPYVIAPSEHEFSVIGQFNGWDDDLMLSDDDGDGVYEAVIEDLPRGNSELKVRMDCDWGYNWGAVNEYGYSTASNNYVVTLQARADVLITFDTNDEDFRLWTISATAVEGSEDKYDQNVGKYDSMSLFGTLVGNYDEDADMEYVGHDVYTITLKDIEAGSYETVVRGNHEWANYWGVWDSSEETSKYGDPVQFTFTADVIQLMISIDTSPDNDHDWIISYDYNTADGKYHSGDAITSYDEPDDEIYLDEFFVGVCSDATGWGAQSDIEMVRNNNGQYYAEFEVPDGYDEFYFKVRLDNEWYYSWGQKDYSTGISFGKDAVCIYPGGKAATVKVWFNPDDDDYRYWYMQWDYDSSEPYEPVVEPVSGNIEDYYYFDDNRTLHILPGFEKFKEAEEYFSYDDGVFNVIFENGVTAVPDGLFDGCQELETVELTDGLVRIGKNAFRDCDKLEGELILPETVEYLGESAFAGCRNLTLAAVEVGIQTVTKGAFANCTGLTELGLSSNLRKIGAAAFRRCQGLKEVTIRPNVTEIADNAFAGCDSNLVIKGVAGTEAESFARRAGFRFVALSKFEYDFEDDGTIFITRYNGTDENVTVPATIDGYQVTRIGACAFIMNEYIKTVDIPEGIITIGMLAFRQCPDLETVTLHDGVELINGGAFMDCPNLIAINFPDSITSFGPHAFGGCSRLERINEVYDLWDMGAEVFNDTKWFSNHEDGPVYYGNMLIGYKGEAEYGSTLEIREGTIGVAAGALAGSWGARNNITAVTFPESLTYVGPNSFWEMYNYTEIRIPATVTRIEDGAFGCYWDQENSRPGHVDGVVIYGTYGSAAHGYANRNGFEFVSDEPMITSGTTGDCTWTYDPDRWYLTISGSGAMADYSYNSYAPWRNYAIYNIDVLDGVTHIGSDAFMGLGNPEYQLTVNLADSVTSIGDNAFNALLGGLEINGNRKSMLPANLTTIGNYAIFNKEYNNVFVPATVTSIGKCGLGYYYDDELEKDVKVENYTIHCYKGSAAEQYAIDNGLFYVLITDDGFEYIVNDDGTATVTGCILPLTALYIPDDIDGHTVTEIGDHAFADYQSLVSIRIPPSVRRIGKYAFQGDYNLKSIDLPDALKILDEGALCWSGINVSETAFPDGLEYIGENAFFSVNGDSAAIPASVTYIGAGAIGYYTGGGDGFVPIEGFTIYGMTNSAAEQYARDNGFAFDEPALVDEASSLKYIINSDNTVTVVGRTTQEENLVIPEKIAGLTVTAIGSHAFDLYKSGDIITVTLPSTLKVLGDYAFWGRSEMKSMNLPESIEHIGDSALCFCYINLENAPALPESLKYLGGWALFPMNTDTTSITIPAGIEYMGDRSVGFYAPADYSAPIEGFTIYGTPDTAAEAYAEEYGFEFVDVDANKLRNTSTLNAETLSLGSRIYFTNSAEGGDGNYTYTYFYKKSTARLWTAVPATSITATGGFFTPKSCAVYDIKMVVTDGTGETAEVIRQVAIVDGKSTAFRNISTVSTTLAVPKTRIYLYGEAGGSEGYRYAYYYKRTTTSIWTVLGTEFGTDTSASFRPSSEGEFNVKIDIIDVNGELVSKTFNVTISEAAANIPQNLSTISGVPASGGGIKITITGAASGGTGSYTYTYEQKKTTANVWNVLGTANTTSTTQTFTARSTGTYEIKVTVTDSAGMSAEKILYVDIV